MTEGELASKNGRVPLTNNLIRQLVKTIVGRFRASLAEAGARPSATALRNQLDELDSRMLEEFLISAAPYSGSATNAATASPDGGSTT